MSTGADLRYVELTQGEWYYEYQCYPYGCSEAYDVYGPFESETAAREHCDSHKANAGGSTTYRHPAVLEHGIVLSGPPTKPSSKGMFFGGGW